MVVDRLRVLRSSISSILTNTGEGEGECEGDGEERSGGRGRGEEWRARARHRWGSVEARLRWAPL